MSLKIITNNNLPFFLITRGNESFTQIIDITDDKWVLYVNNRRKDSVSFGHLSRPLLIILILKVYTECGTLCGTDYWEFSRQFENWEDWYFILSPESQMIYLLKQINYVIYYEDESDYLICELSDVISTRSFEVQNAKKCIIMPDNTEERSINFHGSPTKPIIFTRYCPSDCHPYFCP